jgi:hypothetical protein
MNFLLLPVFILSFLSLGIGLFLAIKPAWAIEIQRRFYFLINWRMEPVSMEKELLNTRLMGVFLIVIALITIIYSATKL